jgi:hypothetical protein
MRKLVATIAAGLSLAAVIPATASAANPRPAQAQASAVTRQFAERAAEGLRSYRIFEIERVTVSCADLFGSGPRSLTCAYAIFVRNTEDGTSHYCLNTVDVSKARKTGRLRGDFGNQSCF